MSASPTTSSASDPTGTASRAGDDYMAFIAEQMPKLKGYLMEVH
jgi:hypothetical protein